MAQIGTCSCGNTFTRPDRNTRCRACAQGGRRLKYPDHASVGARIQQRCTVNKDGCWIWSGPRVGKPGSKAQYGSWLGLKIMAPEYLVHRMMYIIHRGPIPAGLTVNHRCRVHLCVNPAHLELMTRAENIADGNRFIVDSRGGGCRHGHLPGRMTLDKRGWRGCLDCKAAQMMSRKKGIPLDEARRLYPTLGSQ